MPDLEVVVTPRASADRVGPYRDGVLKRIRVSGLEAGELNRRLAAIGAD